MATMLRDEPELLYMYEYIKVDRSKKEDLSHVIPDEWNIGDMIYTTNPLMDKQYYKFVATYRRAFVGDMQEKFDKAYKINNMKNYVDSAGGKHVEYITKYKEVIIKENIFRQFEEWIKELWERMKKKKEETKDDWYLEDLLFNKENEPIVFLNKKTNI